MEKPHGHCEEAKAFFIIGSISVHRLSHLSSDPKVSVLLCARVFAQFEAISAQSLTIGPRARLPLSFSSNELVVGGGDRNRTDE